MLLHTNFYDRGTQIPNTNICTTFQTSSATTLYFQPSSPNFSHMTKPIRDIVMAESTTRSHTSNARSVPEWNDQYHLSITNVSAMTPNAPTVLHEGSLGLPPDEVYMIPAPVGATNNQ